MFSVQADQCSTQTLLLWSHAVGIDSICSFALSRWNMQALPKKDVIRMGAYVTAIHLPALMVPCQMFDLAISQALMHPDTIRDPLKWALVKRDVCGSCSHMAPLHHLWMGQWIVFTVPSIQPHTPNTRRCGTASLFKNCESLFLWVLPSRQGRRHAQLYLLLSPPNVVLTSFESILARVALWSSPLPSAIPVISSSPLNPCTS